MATFTAANTASIDFTNLGLSHFADATLTTVTSTLVRATLAGGLIVELRGAFVLDAEGDLAGGTITTISELNGTTPLYDLTGLSYSVAQFQSFVAADDGAG